VVALVSLNNLINLTRSLRFFARFLPFLRGSLALKVFHLGPESLVKGG
jgi:hypothetical protein